VGVGALLLVAGCGSSTEDQLHDQLQDRLDGVHGGYLAMRSHDPYSTGSEALQALDQYDYAVESSADGNTIRLVRVIAAEVFESKFAAPGEEHSMGACVEVTVVAGEGGGDRGSVTTEPIECPAGTEGDGETDLPQEATIDLDGRSDGVPEPRPDRSVCISGELCTEGGG
jgi:hypothetical protein